MGAPDNGIYFNNVEIIPSQDSIAEFKVETNEAYFGPGAVGGNAPPPRMPNPRMAPSPTAPQAKPQTPPASQAPASDAKPN